MIDLACVGYIGRVHTVVVGPATFLVSSTYRVVKPLIDSVLSKQGIVVVLTTSLREQLQQMISEEELPPYLLRE